MTRRANEAPAPGGAAIGGGRGWAVSRNCCNEAFTVRGTSECDSESRRFSLAYDLVGWIEACNQVNREGGLCDSIGHLQGD